MLLTVDIGNTSIKIAVFDGSRKIAFFKLPTSRNNSAGLFSNIQEQLKDAVSAVIVSSVVSEVETSFRSFCVNDLNVEPIFVDQSFDFGFSIEYNPPESCGIDRLVAAFAAKERFGIPVIICDLGTAVTIDAVTEDRLFMGGVIFPGPKTMAESLARRSSKLPEIEIVERESVFGNSTISSIQSGVLYATVGAVEKIVNEMRQAVGHKAKVIATGGFSRLIAKHSDSFDQIEDDMILLGLRDIYHKLTIAP